LERASAVVELTGDRRGGVLHETLHQLFPQRRIGVHQPFGVLVGAARPAFDEVAGDRERSAGERQQRHVVGQLGGEDLHRLGHVRGVGVGLERAQAVEVGRLPERRSAHRAGARCDVDPESDGVCAGTTMSL
jgi:hypothetical protein